MTALQYSLVRLVRVVEVARPLVVRLGRDVVPGRRGRAVAVRGVLLGVLDHHRRIRSRPVVGRLLLELGGKKHARSGFTKEWKTLPESVHRI